MHRQLITIAALAATLALFGGAAVGQPTILKTTLQADEVTVVCEDTDGDAVGTVTYHGPLTMWPPNHKYQEATITATAADEDVEVELVTAGTHDEYLEDGSELPVTGDTDDDVAPELDRAAGTGSASTAHSLRSERSGQGDGRTYTLDWEAVFTDADGDLVRCGSIDVAEEDLEIDHTPFAVEVPRDLREATDEEMAEDGGPDDLAEDGGPDDLAEDGGPDDLAEDDGPDDLAEDAEAVEDVESVEDVEENP